MRAAVLFFLALSASNAARKEQIDRLVEPAIAKQRAVGIVAGILENGKIEVYGYGKLSADQERPPGADTVFEIGSITKVFTGILLADLAERKIVSLDDPVRKYLPAGKIPPSPEGAAEIRLVDLSAHVSGLPRLPGNMRPKDPANPYADYTSDQLYEFLSVVTLVRKPSAAYLYSNLGAGLLGHALSLAAKKSYEDLIVERIAKPLKLDSTRITLGPELRARLARGHDAQGKPVRNWDLDLLAGAGALRSTANDMLKFLAANIDPRGALKMAQVPRAKLPGPAGEIALGWHITGAGKTYWHNGGTAGYTSYIAFDPERKVAAVVLINTSGTLMNELGRELMELLR